MGCSFIPESFLKLTDINGDNQYSLSLIKVGVVMTLYRWDVPFDSDLPVRVIIPKANAAQIKATFCIFYYYSSRHDLGSYFKLLQKTHHSLYYLC